MAQMKRYHVTSSRLESRGAHPPTREYVDELVRAMRESGWEACWHSAVDADSRPLFPSKIIPNCHARADMESFRYLIGSLHAIGRPVVSWYSLNHSLPLVEDHPDWRMIPLEGEGLPVPNPTEDARRYCCINSPYGRILPDFAVEIVREVGFDGIWFDGSTFATSGNSCPGCLCEHCRRRFRNETGLDLPHRVDFDSPDFRRWVEWRYECLMDLWKRTSDAVLAARPDATVCFNNYRRRRKGVPIWATGIPMRHLGWDVVMAGEFGLDELQADFQMKMHRAYGCRRGAEAWSGLADYWSMHWVPDVQVLPQRQGVVAALSAGGLASHGTGVHPRLLVPLLKSLCETAAELAPYRDGETVEYAAIWVSRQTQDFRDRLESTPTWDQYHGANELCLHAHVQTSVIFDDHVRDGDLDRYPVLLAGAACVDERQAKQLRRYVERGGVLFACSDIGDRDEMGLPHKSPILGELLGVASWREGVGGCTLELDDPALADAAGKWVSFPALPYRVCEPMSGITPRAMLVERPHAGHWEESETLGRTWTRLPALWTMRLGHGTVIYVSPNIMAAYLSSPTRQMLRLFEALLLESARPPVRLEGPLCVTMNCRRHDERSMFVHLHNAPGTVYRYSNSSTVHSSGEIVPVHDLVLHIRDSVVRSARSALSGETFAIAGGRAVHIPRLECNDVVLLELA